MQRAFYRLIFICIMVFSFNSLVFSAQIDSADWPMASHDTDNTATNPHEHAISPHSINKLAKSWEAPGASVEVIPAVVDGKVYFTDFNNVLWARNANDGSLIWSTSLDPANPRQNHCPVLVVDRFLFVGLSNGNVYKVDRSNGKVLWTTHIDPDPTLKTNIDGGIAFAKDANLIMGGTDTEQTTDNPPYTYRGIVFALDAKTGAVKWRFYTTNNDAQSGPGVSIQRSTPAIDPELGLMFIGTQSALDQPAGPLSASLLALNYKTKSPNGELVWKYQFVTDAIFSLKFPNGDNFNVAGNPNLFTIKDHGHKRRLVGVAGTGGIYAAVDRVTGELVWKKKLIPDNVPPSFVISNPSAAFDNGVLYTAGYYDPDNLFPGPVFIASVQGDINALKQGLLAFTSGMKARVQALDASNGNVLWQQDFAGVGAAAPVTFANGIVYFDSTNGILYALNAKDGSILKTFETPFTEVLGLNFRIPYDSGVSISRGKIFTGTGVETIPPGGGLSAFALADMQQ